MIREHHANDPEIDRRARALIAIQGCRMKQQAARTDFRNFFYWLNTPPWTIERGSSTFLETLTVKFPLVCSYVHHVGPYQCLLCHNAVWVWHELRHHVT